MLCDESWINCYDPETKRQSPQSKHAGSPRPKKARQNKSTHKLLMLPFFDSTGMIYMHWVPTEQTVNKEYYVKVLREFRKRFCRERPALFKSSQWHFHQDNAPVLISILATDYLTKMGIKTIPQPPYSPNLRTVGTVQQMHCSRRRLLRRGLEFHMCTTNKSAHT